MGPFQVPLVLDQFTAKISWTDVDIWRSLNIQPMKCYETNRSRSGANQILAGASAYVAPDPMIMDKYGHPEGFH